jgi:hypothetical protein
MRRGQTEKGWQRGRPAENIREGTNGVAAFRNHWSVGETPTGATGTVALPGYEKGITLVMPWARNSVMNYCAFANFLPVRTSAPAFATSSSCAALFAPLTPMAPTTWPS